MMSTIPEAAMGPAVKAYYGDPAAGAVPAWTNRLAVLSWPEWLDFDGVSPGAALRVPTLMVQSEDAAFPDNARRFADAAGAALEWHDGSQIELYYKPAQVDRAVAAVARHLADHLGAPQNGAEA